DILCLQCIFEARRKRCALFKELKHDSSIHRNPNHRLKVNLVTFLGCNEMNISRRDVVEIHHRFVTHHRHESIVRTDGLYLIGVLDIDGRRQSAARVLAGALVDVSGILPELANELILRYGNLNLRSELAPSWLQATKNQIDGDS